MCVYGAQKQAATGISTRMLSQKLQNPVIYVSPSCKPLKDMHECRPADACLDHRQF